MDKVETLDEIKEAAARIQEMGAGYVVIKSGSRNNSDEAVDVLYDGKNYVVTSGLNIGDRIVVEGVGTSVRDGMSIKPITLAESAAKRQQAIAR